MVTKESLIDGMLVQMTGMSGAGKSTLAKNVSKNLSIRGYKVEVIDGDVYREKFCPDLGYSEKDRRESVNRLASIGEILVNHGVIVLMPVINPYEDLRSEIKERVGKCRTAYVKCDIESLKERDPKGLYARAMLPDDNPDKIRNFTGIDSRYDEPLDPDIVLETDVESTSECSERLLNYLLKELSL